MRFTTLTVLLTALLLSACGSDNNSTDNSSSAQSSVPPIIQGDPNEVSYAQGEFLNAFSFVDDEANNRWLIADKAQGVLAIDKTSNEVQVITPLAHEDNDSHLQSISDLVLDGANNTIYMLDLTGEQIISADSFSGATSIAATKEDFNVEEKFAWEAPTSLFFDEVNSRLLIADSYGLEDVDSNGDSYSAFSTFIYTPSTNTISVLSPNNTIENPVSSIEVKDIYYEASDDTLYTSGVYRRILNNAINYYYGATKIDVATWESTALFLDLNVTIDRNSSTHSISYDKASNKAFVVNSAFRTILALDITLIEDVSQSSSSITSSSISSSSSEALKEISIVMYFDDQDYPVSRPSQVALNSSRQLFVFDEKDSSLFSLDYAIDSPSDDGLAARELQVSGRPITPKIYDRPQVIADISVEAETGDLLITDRSRDQRDALSYDGNNFNVFDFEFDVAGVVPDELTLEEGETINFALYPKPAFITQDASTGDLIVLGFSFAQATDDPLVYNVFKSALYRRKVNEVNAEPISTAQNSDDETKLITFPFDVSDIRKLAASSNSVYFGLNVFSTSSSALWLWDETENQLEFIIENTPFIPSQLKGMVYDHANNRLIFVDSAHDALISVSEKNADDERTFSVISGRENTQDPYIPLPSGLALNHETQTAYTFENDIRAVISIDLETGKRARIDSDPNFIRSADKMSLSNDGATLFITERYSNRIIALDIATGEQRWIDK